MKDEARNIQAAEASGRETIRQLQFDLDVYKKVVGRMHIEQKEAAIVIKEKEDLEIQLMGYGVTALLDGDGVIFSGDLIAKGLAGGHDAARLLSDSIKQHITMNYGANQYKLNVHVF